MGQFQSNLLHLAGRHSTGMRFLSMVVLTGMTVLGTSAVGRAQDNAVTPRAALASETNGLRLEVTAELDDVLSTQGKAWSWDGASLSIAVALRNISAEQITVPTTAFDEQPVVRMNEGAARVLIQIVPLKFLGESTAFVPSRFAPAMLGPGERVLILRRRIPVAERMVADTLKHVSAVFGVSRDFDAPHDWWRGTLETRTEIRRRLDPDQSIAQLEATEAKLAARKQAEQDPNYGPAHAARIAALIGGSEMARIRGEMEKEPTGVEVRNADWIQQVAEAAKSTSLAKSVQCFCTGWRTAYFYKDGQMVVSVATIHGNQLRIHWDTEVGDYPITETGWKAVERALQMP